MQVAPVSASKTTQARQHFFIEPCQDVRISLPVVVAQASHVSFLTLMHDVSGENLSLISQRSYGLTHNASNFQKKKRERKNKPMGGFLPQRKIILTQLKHRKIRFRNVTVSKKIQIVIFARGGLLERWSRHHEDTPSGAYTVTRVLRFQSSFLSKIGGNFSEFICYYKFGVELHSSSALPNNDNT